MFLIVLDDESRIASLIATLARERGWSAAVAISDTEFQKLYSANVPDAIMLDLRLGASDGIEQLRFLQAARYRGAIVLMSGFDPRVLASAQQVGRSLGLRIATVLEKPARVTRIRDVLKELETQLEPGAVFDQTESPAAPEADSIQPEGLADALQHGEMDLYLQPILNAAYLSVVRLEGLIRWRRPDSGIVLPDKFISVAERDPAVIDRLTFWVIKTALDQYLRLAEFGYAIPISVNISGMNLRSLDFPDRLAELVAQAGAPPSALALEITESVAMHDRGPIVDILTRLRLKGFELAIDDLGTGHSSLEALKEMPFSEIKIDKSFVSDALKSRTSLAIVTSIIDLAGRMGVVCTAEGVESDDISVLVSNLGITYLQGYFYSRPIPFSSLVTWLAAWTAAHRSDESNRSTG
ncbi:MAG TPA: EAL domain-containing response regulator [Rudaea sp.]|jgi:EAL domain-containing protein (putative c-di-GMP-specific phosphodiesterase class I)|nr:EAL domain-containing response regulator [Rudaea sp.]